METPKKLDTVAEVKHRYANSVASLECASVTKSIIYIIMRKEAPFTIYPAAKRPKHSKFAITNLQEKPGSFFCCTTWASTLAPTIILLTQAPLQKFPYL